MVDFKTQRVEGPLLVNSGWRAVLFNSLHCSHESGEDSFICAILFISLPKSHEKLSHFQNLCTISFLVFIQDFNQNTLTYLVIDTPSC